MKVPYLLIKSPQLDWLEIFASLWNGKGTERLDGQPTNEDANSIGHTCGIVQATGPRKRGRV